MQALRHADRYKHKTGDGSPESIRSIDYREGFQNTVDDFGGTLVNNGKMVIVNGKRVRTKESATCDEMRASIDQHGEHSFIFPCHFALFSGKAKKPIEPMKEIATQKFSLKAVSGPSGETGYVAECRKWNNFSRRTAYPSGKVFKKYESWNEFRVQDYFVLDENKVQGD
ncbi:MAG: hypothetical protein LBG65_05855 [Puniceicoccales bacterium]|jgi:hypothetical protein|nr:hypothetical protein [Puniceicoccales bacterium]